MSEGGTDWAIPAAVALLLGFLLYQQKKVETAGADIVDNAMDIVNAGLNMLNPGSQQEQPAYTLDVHGCRSDIQRYCPQSGLCLDIAQTCRSLAETDLSYLHDDNLDQLIANMNAPPESSSEPVIRVSDMCYKGGYPILTVPPGTSCEDAMAVMCQRFGPGSKFC